MAVFSEQLQPHTKRALLCLVMPVTTESAMSGASEVPQVLCYHKQSAKAKLHKSAHVTVIAIAKRANIPQEPGLQYKMQILKE